MTFNDLEIIEPILRALKDEGYSQPTPIQEQSIPIILGGKDLLGCAQTGTGKTAAFSIPILQQLYNANNNDESNHKIRALIITPTRELAIQIKESFSNYGRYTGLTNSVIYGGVKQGKQVNRIKSGIDILVATPGRLLDLMNQGFISLRDVEYFVLDEADHMLDMGFIHDIRKIVAKLPSKRQSLFFSATMPPAIIDLSGKILGKPERITIKPKQATADSIDQAVYYVSKANKPNLLKHVLQSGAHSSVLVFSRTKHGANSIVKNLDKADITAEAIHGNKSQPARQRALENFKSGETKVLVATDIAARGIDVDKLSLVINYDLPNVPETYVHRIGRTGRAHASGIAISFCDGPERAFLNDIQKLISTEIPIVEEHPYLAGAEVGISEVKPKKKQNSRSGPRQSSSQKSTKPKSNKRFRQRK